MMKSEKIITKTLSQSVSFSGNRVDAYRCKDDMTTVIRVYEGGNIGVAAATGEDDGTLFDKAKQKLSQGIPYPENLEANKQRTIDANAEIIPEKELVPAVKSLVAKLASTYPDFIFSYKVTKTTVEKDYTNSENTHYSYKGSRLDVYPQIKEKKSANIVDLYYGQTVKNYSEDEIVANIGVLLNVYNNKVELPEEDVPIAVNTGDILGNLLPEVLAEKYMTGASLLKDKLNQKVFSKKLTVYTDKTENNLYTVPFFDAEGTTCEGDKFNYIKDGVFCGIATYKRSAEKYSLPLSSSAYTEFDEVPRSGFTPSILLGTKGAKYSDIKGKSIYVALTSGGDMSPDGDISLPVMAAFLCEDGKPVGVLPQFSVSGNLFSVLGDNLVSVVENDMFKGSDEQLIVTGFTINK